jgi:hypothetical protein
MKAREFDERFDAGEDVADEADWSRAWRPVVESLDHEAQRLGVTRQSLIKLWIAERLG